jgi:hypothetical protein
MNHEPNPNAGELSGGHLKDIPLPHLRRSPRYAPRLVRIVIQHYAGIGVHWYVDIREEHNPIWNPLTNAEAHPDWDNIQGTEWGQEVIGWQSAWDDDKGKGRTFHSPRLKSPHQAQNWIRETIAKHFQPESDYDFRDVLAGKRWFYKEGD